ncbi:MAG: histidine--tRNA ligase [Patescibacteria group bacterium UBA2163]
MAQQYQPYKGVRDFYPREKRFQQYLFSIMEKTAESFGYEAYDASLLEPTELYTTKTSEEIITEQTYTFTDRGGRSVTLRPEMTPTVARMVAQKRRELGFPLRWYSIPNCFRYERPQKGRGREFWQLNVDLFGVEGMTADAEIIELAYSILKNYGATDDMFTIKVADRVLLETAFDAVGMDKEQKKAYRQLLDKKRKLSDSEFKEASAKITDTDPIALIEGTDDSVKEAECAVRDLVETLHARGVTNVEFDPSIVRGFDYYTGVVFEIFDTSGENLRSIFGGGRYDYLVEEYGGDHVPAVGFGMGDMTTQDFLITHNLLPEDRATADIYLAPISEADVEHAAGVAAFWREKGVNVALGIHHDTIAAHAKAARKLAIPYLIVYGEDEAKSGMLRVKDLHTKEEQEVTLEDVPRVVYRDV